MTAKICKNLKRSALKVLKDCYAPILKFWKTVYFLITQTEEYHRNPDILFNDELVSNKGVLKWSTFTYVALTVAVGLSITNNYNLTGLLFNSLVDKVKAGGWIWIARLSYLFPFFFTLCLLLRLLLFGPFVVTEALCNKLYKRRKPSIRFVYSLAPLYAVLNFIEALFSFVFSVVISFIYKGEPQNEFAEFSGVARKVVAILSMWFVFYIYPKHLAYRYKISIYKAVMLVYFAPWIIMPYGMMIPFSYLFYLVGRIVDLIFAIVFPFSWPYRLRRLKAKIRDGGLKNVVFANRERGEPRLGSKWLTASMIILLLLYVYYMNQRSAKRVEENSLISQEPLSSTQILASESSKNENTEQPTDTEQLTEIEKLTDTEQPIDEKLDMILIELNKKTVGLKTLEAKIEYNFIQPWLFSSEALRKGMLYYSRFDNESKLRVNFLTLKLEDEEEQKYLEEYIVLDGDCFDYPGHQLEGTWLLYIDHEIKSFNYYQLAVSHDPNRPEDVFGLISRKLPIIGLIKTEDLKKQFYIKLVDQKKTEQQDFIQVHLKVKTNSIYKDDYVSIDLWIDKKLGLPTKIIAVTTNKDISEIIFVEPKLNGKIDKKIFDVTIPEDFKRTINNSLRY